KTFAPHQDAHRAANDVAAADHHRVFSFGFDVVALEKFEDPEWRCGNKCRHIEGHFTEVLRMETVDVFGRIDCHDDLLCVDLLRKWELYDEPVDVIVVVELFDLDEEFGFRCCARHADQCRLEPDRFTRFYLAVDVGQARAVVSYDDGSQVRNLFAHCFHTIDFGLDFSFDVG